MFGTAAANCGQRGLFTRVMPGLLLGLALLASGPSLAQSTKTTSQNQAAATTGSAVEREGVLEVIHWDNLDKTSSFKRYLRTNDGKRFELKFKKHAPSHLTGTRIKVRGMQSGNVLALDSSTSSYQVLAMPAPNAVGAQNTAVLLVNFTDNTTQPFTTTQVNSTVFGSANNYFKENSSQQTWLTGSVYGWLTLPMTQTCSYYNIATAANTAAANAGIDLSPYTRFVYIFPYNSTCGWSGMGTVGGSPSDAWLNGRLATTAVTHEMGHNLGLYHSHSMECGATSIGSSCTSSEYGDPFDVMGAPAGTAHYNAFQKERLGWLNYGTSPTITTVSSSGTYAIEPYETSTTGAKALKILKSTDPTTGNKTWYYVELRQALGQDTYLSSYPNVVSGVLVHTGADGDGNSSYLLDMTPNSSTNDWIDPALTAGQSFTDSTAGITVTVQSVSSTGTSVSVSLAGQTASTSTCTHANPTVSLSPGQSPTVTPGTAVTYTLSVTNTDSSACSSSQFNLNTVVPSGWSVSSASSVLSLAPGGSGSTSVVVTSPTTATTGYYGVSSTATNGSATSYKASASATYALATSSTTTTQPPVAVNDSATTKVASPVNIPVLANDSDPAGKKLTVIAVGAAAHGKAVINADGTVTYSPNGKYKGSDSFSYTISDSSSTASAMVSIQISR
ncbi:Ig-like domain-containing protein [Pseudogulbenkiania ferrooxidans]|uniref:Peptidase M11 gametolysin n=1 Tax=Pseudogulbenkiania ferrooxidans 2002 TaxID=279714 RepID=B9Z6A9_9NEIS|nr:Ig-like domain-containing protein [Pseudogulbenkiania ferrooxidans]EEG07753.1 Peptidase M11 gametolysin [Pseudogulbenkiania ferrooxidans 2002]